MANGFRHTGNTALPPYEEVRGKYNAEQVLSYFGIPIGDNNKCICPFHEEDKPSMMVHERNVYCFGCKVSLDLISLTQRLLEKQKGCVTSIEEVFEILLSPDLPDKTDRRYVESRYEGAVNPSLIDYWHQYLTDSMYKQLEQERLLTRETVDRHLLGWRPDWKAWTIPFIQPDGKIDVVMFRMTEEDAPAKYLGLKGHNRGTVMNADLLLDTQEYLIVLFGSFDAIVARQDGLLAVGLNGSNPFKKTESRRVKELFEKQNNIIIIPDNTVTEYEPAETLAKLIGADVQFFPAEYERGLDYVDYRKKGLTADDFLTEVAHLQTITQPDLSVVESVVELLKRGDSYRFSELHAARAVGTPAVDFAVAVANRLEGTENQLYRSKLRSVKSVDELYASFRWIAEQKYIQKGGW